MLSRLLARSLIGIVPEKLVARITLLPDTVSPTTITVFHAWLKPLQVRLTRYGQLNLQGDETLIKIPDDELNPVGNGREIRPRDQIVINSTNYRVLAVRLMSVRTVWECLCRQELV